MSDDEVSRAVAEVGVSGMECTFAERLDYLFEKVHPPSRGPYTYAEVAESIRRSAGDDDKGISASAIQKLRTASKTNPTMHTIRSLAEFFGVQASYFFDDEVAQRTDAEIELMIAMKNQGVRQVALRASGLSTSSLQMLRTVIEQTRRLEGLAAEPPAQS